LPVWLLRLWGCGVLLYLKLTLQQIKGEYFVRNTTNIGTDVIFYDLKLHVLAFIGHLQVSTIL